MSSAPAGIIDDKLVQARGLVLLRKSLRSHRSKGSLEQGMGAPAPPIFIHSLFRAASTYFFGKFRALGHRVTCYQEPFNEALVALNRPARQQRLLMPPECSTLRHPPLDKPYFYEFWTRRRYLQGLFRRAFAYSEYFTDSVGRLSEEQVTYVSALIECAGARTVLQCCRSSGRWRALRENFGGVHVYLWREPRIQWWSYKAAGYFDNVSRRIYRSLNLPRSLRVLGALTDIGIQQIRHLSPRDNYLMFYGLWFDSWLRLRWDADLSINLDAIGGSATRSAECARALSDVTDLSIDLADVRLAGMVFTPQEQDFYGEIEHAVHEIFLQTGCATRSAVGEAVNAARAARAVHEDAPHDRATERALRQARLDLMTCVSTQERMGWRGWLARLRTDRQWTDAAVGGRPLHDAGNRERLSRRSLISGIGQDDRADRGGSGYQSLSLPPAWHTPPVAGIERDGLVVTRDRFIETLEVLERVAAIEVGDRLIGLEDDRRVVAGNGFIEAPELLERVAAIDVSHGQVRIQRDRLVATVERLVRSAGSS